MFPLSRHRGGRNPLSVLDDFLKDRDDFDHFVDNLSHFLGRPVMNFVESSQYIPAINMEENDNAYSLSIELPGMKIEDVDISITNNILSISGSKIEEKKEEKTREIYTERCFGKFRRDIPLSTNCDTDNIKAKYKQGILNITIPKIPKEAPPKKKIDIAIED